MKETKYIKFSQINSFKNQQEMFLIHNNKLQKIDLNVHNDQTFTLTNDQTSQAINNFDFPAFSNEHGKTDILEIQNLNSRKTKYILWVNYNENENYLFDLEQRTIRHHAYFTLSLDEEITKLSIDCFNNLIM